VDGPDKTSLNPAERIIFADKVLQERALRKGRREGKIEGKIEGKREGTQEFLLKQLKQRFGELPTHAMTRLQTATLADLEEMGLRVLSASTLEDVLGTPKRKRK
jgi:predicted transposase YdaD